MKWEFLKSFKKVRFCLWVFGYQVERLIKLRIVAFYYFCYVYARLQTYKPLQVISNRVKQSHERERYLRNRDNISLKVCVWKGGGGYTFLMEP